MGCEMMPIPLLASIEMQEMFDPEFCRHISDLAHGEDLDI